MATAAASDAATSPPWPDLPPDLLRHISGCLHTPTNYVRFHAVCRSWRDSLPPPERRPAFLPWLVAPRDATGHRKARCVFSSKPSRKRRHGNLQKIRVPDRRWVASAEDGRATCWIDNTTSVTVKPAYGLVDLLTGTAAAISLPRYEDEVESWEESAVGVISGDGTVIFFAYGRVRSAPRRWNLLNGYGFDAAVRHPDDTEWRLLQKNDLRYFHCKDWRRYRVAYRNGRIMLLEGRSWCILSVQGAIGDQETMWIKVDPGMSLERSYLVESHGELLCVFVLLDEYDDKMETACKDDGVSTIGGLASALSVSVYAFQDAESGEPQWVKRDGRSLAERVLFLGQPGSFAMDAARFGMSGRGCAYFVDRSLLYGGIWSKSAVVRCRLFKYSFHNGRSELVEQLPEDWNDAACMWLTPQPAIATTEEIRERLDDLKIKAAGADGPLRTSFRIYVGNLPRKVDTYQLGLFCSKHGKVDDARVMHDKGTRLDS